MKQILFTFTFCGFCLLAHAQDASVEKNTYGIQTGFLGIWGHNETKLTNLTALRTEIGFDSGIWGGEFYDGVGFVMTPVIAFEPRLYYNLKKRTRRERKTAGNHGNFVSIKTSYHPDWFVISNEEGLRVISDVSIIPTWGIRRNIGDHFTFETGIGIGWRYYFAKRAGYTENTSEVDANLHLRFGYRF